MKPNRSLPETVSDDIVDNTDEHSGKQPVFQERLGNSRLSSNVPRVCSISTFTARGVAILVSYCVTRSSLGGRDSVRLPFGSVAGYNLATLEFPGFRSEWDHR